MLALVPRLNRLAEEYQGRVSFAVVYIAEAHAKDEWPVGDAISFCDQPKQIDERLQLARQLQSSRAVSVPVYVDTMDDCFLKQYSPWPLRFFVLSEGTLRWKAVPCGSGYDIEALAQWLKLNL